MKLPLTDKFLLDLYDELVEIRGTLNVVFPSRYKYFLQRELYEVENKYWKKKDKKAIESLIYRLRKNGYIKIENLKGIKSAMITRDGLEKVFKVKLLEKIGKKRKDKKWLMLIFDIPEKKRSLRDSFRGQLKGLGFRMLQRSIWVCPYDIDKELENMVRLYEIDSYVKLFLIEKINL